MNGVAQQFQTWGHELFGPGGLLEPPLKFLAMFMPAVDRPFGFFLATILLLAFCILIQPNPPRSAFARLSYLTLFLLISAATVVSGAGVISSLPAVAAAAIYPLLFAAVVWLSAKVILGHRFAMLRDSRRVLEPGAGFLSREEFVTKLRRYVREEPRQSVIGIRGGWGSGKTFIVERLVETLNDPATVGEKADCVAVRLNVWEYQNYGDLQWGVLQALYAHPVTLARHGWLDLPTWMLGLEWIRLKLVKIKLSGGGNEMQGDGELRLPWQNQLERAVGALRRRRKKVVIVLDEIDRADFLAAQSALTLIHRSLALPGVVVVMPFVQNQIREKAFNPFTLVLPDLRSTAFAWLETWYLKNKQGGHRQPYEWLEKGLADRSMDELQSQLYRELAMMWADMPAEHVESYYRDLEDRYLGKQWLIPAFSPHDILDCIAVPEIAINLSAYGSEKIESLCNWVQTLTPAYSLLKGINLRAFIGAWAKYLSTRPWLANTDPKVPLIFALHDAKQKGGD